MGGLSRDPVKRERQLANLKQGGAPKNWGQTYGMRSGGRASARTLPVDGKAALIYEVLAETAPLRDQVGDLPQADRLVVEILALCLARLESVIHYLAIHSPLDTKGNVRPAAGYEITLRREAAGHADSLGMSPRSRARLGLDLTRSASLVDQAESMRAAGDRLRARASEIEARARDGAQDETLEPGLGSVSDIDPEGHSAPSEPERGGE